MGQKKKRPVFKIKETGESEQTSTPSKGAPPEEEKQDTFEISLNTLRVGINALSTPLLGKFFDECLNVKGIVLHENAIAHIESTCKNEASVKYVQGELDRFIEKTAPPQESEKEEPALPQPQQFDPDNMPEDVGDVPEMSEDQAEALKKALEWTKQKLQSQLDRLTIVEGRCDANDKSHKDIDEFRVGVIDSMTTLKEGLVSELQKIAKEVDGKGGKGSDSGSGDCVIVWPDPAKAPKKLEGIFPESWQRLVQLGMSRINTLMIGPSGCGKTKNAEMLAEALELNFASVSCSDGMDEGVFQGKILPTGPQGQFEYIMSQFMDKYENGGLFFLDEMDAADGNLLTYINSAIGNTSFHNPIRWLKPLVKRHKDFWCLGAANTMGHGGDMVYSSRNALDGATLDRFRLGTVYMDYSPRVEKKIIDGDVYQWGLWIRKGIEALRMSKLMTTRFMENCSQMKSQHKWSVDEWEKSYFVDWKKDDQKRLKKWILDELEKMGRKLERKGK